MNTFLRSSLMILGLTLFAPSMASACGGKDCNCGEKCACGEDCKHEDGKCDCGTEGGEKKCGCGDKKDGETPSK